MKETSRAPPQTLEEIEKDPDLGMNTVDFEPKFDIEKDVDPLYVEKPIGKYEPSASNLERMRAKKDQTADRILRKKFKLEPTT